MTSPEGEKTIVAKEVENCVEKEWRRVDDCADHNFWTRDFSAELCLAQVASVRWI